MAKTLKEQTFSALFWSFMDKGGQQIFQFVLTFVLLRLLLPSEFGLIAVLSIFIAVANILQESGFSSAVIRKKEVDEIDYSTVFYFNVGISIIIYILFFFSAPYIAHFYNQPVLKNLSRFLFLAFVFNSFGIVQYIHLFRQMNFKANAKATLGAVFFSGIVAIYMAYHGYGVWSLAAQQVLQALIRSFLLWLSVKWVPKQHFNKQRLYSMSSYSGKLLLNSLFNQIVNNLYSMVIAKKFSLTDTGYYSQANKINTIPHGVIASTLQSVAFPLLNKFHDNADYKKHVFRKIFRVACFGSFPIAAYIFFAAKPIVYVVLNGGEWVGVIPILQILTIGSAFLPFFYLLSTLLQSVGKSGILLSIEMIRNVLTLVTIIFTVHLGLYWVVVGASSIMVVSFFIGYYIAGKTINYTMSELLKDVIPYLLIAILSFLPTFLLFKITDNMLFLLFAQLIMGGLIYLCILKVCGSKVIEELISLAKNRGFK